MHPHKKIKNKNKKIINSLAHNADSSTAASLIEF